jgi:hypothetical protein
MAQESTYYTGQLRVTPAGTSFDIDPSWYPTASVGFERILASHLGVRAEH